MMPLCRPVGPPLLPLFIAIHSQAIRFVAFTTPGPRIHLLRAQLHRRAGRHQWQYGPEVQKLEAQLKAQQVHEQTNGQAASILGAAFWELRFPKG